MDLWSSPTACSTGMSLLPDHLRRVDEIPFKSTYRHLLPLLYIARKFVCLFESTTHSFTSNPAKLSECLRALSILVQLSLSDALLNLASLVIVHACLNNTTGRPDIKFNLNHPSDFPYFAAQIIGLCGTKCSLLVPVVLLGGTFFLVAIITVLKRLSYCSKQLVCAAIRLCIYRNIPPLSQL